MTLQVSGHILFQQKLGCILLQRIKGKHIRFNLKCSGKLLETLLHSLSFTYLEYLEPFVCLEPKPESH